MLGAEEGDARAVDRDVEGPVAAVPDLPQEEVAHATEGAVRDRGAERDVGDQLEHRQPVAREGGGRDLGVVGIPVGVDAPTHPIGGGRDLLAVQLLGAPHQHDLQHVGDAGGVGRLRARAHLHQEGVGDERRGGVLSNDDGEAVGQVGASDAGRLREGGRRGQQGQESGEGDDSATHCALRGTKARRA